MERIKGPLRAIRSGSCGHTCRADGRRCVAHRQRERCVAGSHELVWCERAGVAVAAGLRDGCPLGTPVEQADEAPAAHAVGPHARYVDDGVGERGSGQPRELDRGGRCGQVRVRGEVVEGAVGVGSRERHEGVLGSQRLQHTCCGTILSLLAHSRRWTRQTAVVASRERHEGVLGSLLSQRSGRCTHLGRLAKIRWTQWSRHASCTRTCWAPWAARGDSEASVVAHTWAALRTALPQGAAGRGGRVARVARGRARLAAIATRRVLRTSGQPCANPAAERSRRGWSRHASCTRTARGDREAPVAAHTWAAGGTYKAKSYLSMDGKQWICSG